MNLINLIEKKEYNANEAENNFIYNHLEANDNINSSNSINNSANMFKNNLNIIKSLNQSNKSKKDEASNSSTHNNITFKKINNTGANTNNNNNNNNNINNNIRSKNDANSNRNVYNSNRSNNNNNNINNNSNLNTSSNNNNNNDIITNIKPIKQRERKPKKKIIMKTEATVIKEPSFNEERQKELKDELINLLGKLLFENIYNIIEKNTPIEYFLFEEEKLKKLIKEKLTEDFKQDKINIAMDRILDVYKLIFAEREKNMLV